MTSPASIVTPHMCVCGDPQCKIPFGECHCGCGGKTKPSVHNRRGRTVGKPQKLIKGHWPNKPLDSLYVAEDRGYTSPCWIWQRSVHGPGMKTGKGYGVIQRVGIRKPAHQAFWEDRNGPVPEGKEIDHLCRVTVCVNPDHLEAVTHAENTRRRTTSKITMEQARQMRVLWAKGWMQKAIAAHFSISTDVVWGVVSNRRWVE